MRLLPILLVLAGCYCSHRVDDDDDDDTDRPMGDGSVGDTGLADGEIPICTPAWGSCGIRWTGSAAATAETPSSPDVAFLPNGDVAVVYRDGDQTFLARFDEAGEVLSETTLGNLGDARIAVHPELGAVVAGERAIRWLDPDFEPVGEVVANRPMGAEAFGVDVAAVPEGFLLFAIPGGPGDPPALQAQLDSEPTTPEFIPFSERSPLLPYEHAEDPSGFATHIGFEAGPSGIFPVAFTVEDSSASAFIGMGEGRGATTFIDGVVAYRDRVFIYYQGFSATLVEVGAAETFQLFEAEGTGNNGHVSSLGDDRIVLFFTETSGRVVARPWRPGGSVGRALELASPDGLRTRDMRSAPWARGLLATWECEAGICAAAIECCPSP